MAPSSKAPTGDLNAQLPAHAELIQCRPALRGELVGPAPGVVEPPSEPDRRTALAAPAGQFLWSACVRRADTTTSPSTAGRHPATLGSPAYRENREGPSRAGGWGPQDRATAGGCCARCPVNDTRSGRTRRTVQPGALRCSPHHAIPTAPPAARWRWSSSPLLVADRDLG